MTSFPVQWPRRLRYTVVYQFRGSLIVDTDNLSTVEVAVFFEIVLLMMRSRIFELILPISDFVGLMILQVRLFPKFGLWSLSVMNASLLAVVSTLSSILSFVTMSFFFMNCLHHLGLCFLVRFCDFQQVVVCTWL